MFSASKTAAPSGYNIQRSVRLRSSASAYFNRTPASNGNRTTWTFSCWVKRAKLGVAQDLLSYYASGINETIQITAADQILRYCVDTSGTINRVLITTNSVLRDPSSWYHIVVAEDTTQATDTNRIKIYVNGVQQTTTNTVLPTLNWQSYINSTVSTSLGGTQGYTDGYLTEVNFIDGQALTPTSFGAYNATTGVWQPKAYSGTYGTNGFFLNFKDNTSTTTLGYDYSGNSNNWTANNVSLTAGVTYDSMLDVPTLTSSSAANFPTLNPLFGSSGTLGNANLSLTAAAANPQRIGTIGVSSGKWYYEVTLTSLPAGSDPIAGFTDINNTSAVSQYVGQASSSYAIYTISTNSFLQKLNNATFTNTNTGVAAQGNIISVALDLDNNKIWFAKNGTWVDSGDPAAGTNSQFTVTAGTYVPAFRCSGGGTSSTIDVNFGQRPFSYTPPTGFVALNTFNLPTPTVKNGAAQFAATTYTGTGATLTVANTVNTVNFQPDFVWVKGRSGVTDHALYDSVRGTTKQLESNTTTAETTEATGLTAFGSTGFTVGALAQMNTNAATYVGWQWKASGTTVSNTSGSITSTVSVNPTAGFSIVTYTGTGANATVGHGLGIAPKMVIVKGRSIGNAWGVWQTALAGTEYLILNTTAAKATAATLWNSTTPTSSVFSLGTDATVNNSTSTYVAYCFSEIAGFSKFGSYTGNGSADGPFVYTGFRPRYVCVKRSNSTGGWTILDSSRDTYNVASNYLFAETTAAEGSVALEDFLSNGFKLRSTSTSVNTNTGTYIYFAFAENPFNYSLAR